MSVLILGNGFDLSMGMKTSYQSYLESEAFTKLVEKNSIAKFLQAKFKVDANWFDLENELAKYSSSQGGTLSIKGDFYSLLESIKLFLSAVEVKIDVNSKSYELVKSFIGKGQIWVFNYTETVEAVFRSFDRPDKPEDYIRHIHGDLKSGKIIVGTDDAQPINSRDAFLKKASFENFDARELREQMGADNHLVIFGHSMGVSDSFYFQELFDKIIAGNSSGNYLIEIFYKKEEGTERLMERVNQLSGNRLGTFRARCQLEFNPA